MAVQELKDADVLKEVLLAKRPVVIEFYKYKADGTENASKRMSKFVDDWSAREGEVQFYRMALADNPQTALALDVQSAPTLLYFGTKHAELIGYYNDDRPLKVLDQVR